MLNILPPQNDVDDEAEWISQRDPAWDLPRVRDEKKALADAAVAALGEGATKEDIEAARSSAILTHPIEVWFACAHRFSHSAPLSVPDVIQTADRPDKTTLIGEYLTGKAAIFRIRPMSAIHYREVHGAPNQTWTVEVVRRGLVRIDVDHAVTGEAVTIIPEFKLGLITDHWLTEIDKQDRSLFLPLANAIYSLSRGTSVVEGKP